MYSSPLGQALNYGQSMIPGKSSASQPPQPKGPNMFPPQAAPQQPQQPQQPQNPNMQAILQQIIASKQGQQGAPQPPQGPQGMPPMGGPPPPPQMPNAGPMNSQMSGLGGQQTGQVGMPISAIPPRPIQQPMGMPGMGNTGINPNFGQAPQPVMGNNSQQFANQIVPPQASAFQNGGINPQSGGDLQMMMQKLQAMRGMMGGQPPQGQPPLGAPQQPQMDPALRSAILQRQQGQ